MAQGVGQIGVKDGIAAVIIATAGPLAAEVSMLAVGGIVGGVVAVAVDQTPRTLLQHTGRVFIGVAVALVLGGLLSRVTPQLTWLASYGLDPGLLWAPVGFALGAFWAPAVTMARRLMGAWRRNDGGAQ